MSFRRILVAVDFEPLSAHTIDVAVDLARAVGAELAFVHVADPEARQRLGLAVDDTRALLAAAVERAGTSPRPQELPRVGRPAPQILEAAQEWRADLVVISSHGRHGVKRVLLGSVAEEVVRHASCPVLVVRPPA